jgi:hypothetical protein
MMTGKALGSTGTVNLGIALGTTGIGTIGPGTVGTPPTTAGGMHQALMTIPRSTGQRCTAKEKGNVLRFSLWQVVHHHSTQVHQQHRRIKDHLTKVLQHSSHKVQSQDKEVHLLGMYMVL